MTAMSRATLSLVATFVVACSPSGRDLAVEVQSDLVPGLELASVAIEIRADDASGALLREAMEPAFVGDPYGSGVRVLDAGGIPYGILHVRVRGLDASRGVLAEYEVTVTTDDPFVVRATLRRSCVRVADCPVCVRDDECAPLADCADARCLEGACFYPPDDARCPGGATCHPARGCLEAPADAGVTDAGPGSCPPGTGDCDRDPRNGCETSLAASSAHCGACARACGVNMGCNGGSCECGLGFLDCDAAMGCETDARVDPARCGACDRACGAGETCAAGACRCGSGPGCAASETCCDGECVDLESDVGHCGACDRFCPGYGHDGCYGGGCGCGGGAVCPAGQQCCDGACLPRADFEHCNSCDRACDPVRTDICDGSFGCLCAALSIAICPAGQRCCPTGCVTGACR